MSSWQIASKFVGWLVWCVTAKRGAVSSHEAGVFASWLLSVWGVVQIVCNSVIFAGFRARWSRWWLGEPVEHVHAGLGLVVTEIPVPRSALLAKLLNCPMCFGWWVGAALSLVGFGLFEPTPLGVLLDGAAASSWCWFAFLLHKVALVGLEKHGVVL